MPRELQEASSLPSQEQWGHCGRLGKCGQIPGLAVTQLGTLFLPGSLSLPPQVGEEWVAASPFCGPWENTGQPSHRKTMSVCLVALPSNLAPIDMSGYKIVRQPQTQSCQMKLPCSRPDCELAERCQHCQLHTWVSSRISCAFGICGGYCRS